MLKLTNKRTKWFTVPQDPSGECQVEVLHLKPGEVAEIESKTNPVIGKQFGDAEFVTEIGFNFPARTKLYVTKCVLNWKGFTDAKDKQMKCTDINKLEVLKEFSWFAEFVEECRKSLAEEVAEETEGAGKN